MGLSSRRLSCKWFCDMHPFTRAWCLTLLNAAKCRRAYVEQLWVDMGGPEKIERLACWDLLLSDDELACLLCRDDMMKGKAILAVMKSVRALDIDGDGHIVKSEFNRLFDPSVIAAAEL